MMYHFVRDLGNLCTVLVSSYFIFFTRSFFSVVFFFYVFFFFKQNTAYEMRISDWSSDVCSSDVADSSRPSLPPIRAAASHLRGISRSPTGFRACAGEHDRSVRARALRQRSRPFPSRRRNPSRQHRRPAVSRWRRREPLSDRRRCKRITPLCDHYPTIQ